MKRLSLMICLILLCAVCMGQVEGNEKSVSNASDASGSQLYVRITSPTAGYIMSGDREVVFDSFVSGGKEPYSYRWSSNVDGTLSSDKSFNQSAINLTKGEHHIIFEVKDESGQSAQRTILIWVTGETIAPQLSEKITSPSSGYNDTSGQSDQSSVSPKAFDETSRSQLSVRITSPAAGYIMRGDQEVVFDSFVSGGKEPYSYKWSSNLDGKLSSDKSFNQSAINLTKGEHHVILEVKDGSVQSAQSTLLVWVM
jgi:hypothetical protein